MRILFFDLENATEHFEGRKECKICEFGYVVTDENFDVTERGNLLIDPKIGRADWDWYVVKKVLTRKKSVYLTNPSFDQRYPKIRELITSADYVVGHSLVGDVKALNDECGRYGLPSLDFSFYDECVIYQRITESKNARSVTNILKDYEIEVQGTEHDAECDAYNTMLGLRAMQSQSKLGIKAFFDKYAATEDVNRDYAVRSQKKKEERAGKRTRKG